MKLSIIIPTYNLEKYIENCLLSILTGIENQSQVEIILVDDCSTDSTVSIASQFAKEYNLLQIIEKPKQTNAGDSRNIGLEAATGEYIWFVDGDDIIAEQAISKALDLIQEDPADVSFIPVARYRDSDGVYLPESTSRRYLSPITAKVTTFQESPEVALVAGFGWNKIVKRSFLVEQNIQFQSITVHNDFYFSFACVVKAESIYVGADYNVDAWYLYRQGRAGSLAGLSDERLLCLLTVLEGMRDDFFPILSPSQTVYALHVFLENLMYRDKLITDDKIQSRYNKGVYAFLSSFNYDCIVRFLQADSPANIQTKNYLFNILWDHGYFKERDIFQGNLAVSLIMASYNTAPCLDRTFEFLKHIPEDTSFFELLIVDDASTDGSVEYFQKLVDKHSYIQLFAFEKNTIGGVGIPGNYGIRKAKGEIIAFLDSDDILFWDDFMKEVSRMYLCQSDILLFDFCNYYEKQDTFAPTQEGKLLAELSKGMHTHRLRDLLLSISPAPWRKFYKRSYLMEKEVFFPEADFFHEDAPFHWFGLTQTENILVSTSVVCGYRREREEQTVSNYGTIKSAPGVLYHLRGIKAFLVNHDLMDLFKASFDKFVLKTAQQHKSAIVEYPHIKFQFIQIALDLPQSNRALQFEPILPLPAEISRMKKKDERWIRFGRMSKKRKVWTMGKILSKKLHLYPLLKPFVRGVKRLVRKK